MSSFSSQVPNLASVLQTLAGLAQNQPPPPTSDQPPGFAVPPQPWPFQPTTSTPKPSVDEHSVPTPQVKVVDPATIVDWPSGLRCVMKTVARHDKLLQDLQRMIKVQHEHEEQWFAGRKALIEKQAGRKEGQKRLDEVLRAVGVATDTGTSDASPEALQRELEVFDLKVYRAQLQMVTEMNARLRGYGIPFFGTKKELVRLEGKNEPMVLTKQEGMIDEAELVNLQRKMISLLEDMCKE